MSSRNPFMPPAPRNKVCPIRLAAARLAEARQAQGITNKMLQTETRSDCTHVGTVLAKMTNEGKLFGATVVGLPKHWFATQALAQHWADTTRPVVHLAPAPTPRMLVKQRKAAAGLPGARLVVPSQPGTPAPVALAPRADRAAVQVVVPPHVVVQRLPSINHDPRYQLPAGARPFGAGFMAVGVGCDVETGRAWEKDSTC